MFFLFPYHFPSLFPPSSFPLCVWLSKMRIKQKMIFVKSVEYKIIIYIYIIWQAPVSLWTAWFHVLCAACPGISLINHIWGQLYKAFENVTLEWRTDLFYFFLVITNSVTCSFQWAPIFLPSSIKPFLSHIRWGSCLKPMYFLQLLWGSQQGTHTL